MVVEGGVGNGVQSRTDVNSDDRLIFHTVVFNSVEITVCW